MNVEGQIKGIERNAPRAMSDEITAWEILNLRHVRGGLRPVGRKPVEITDITGTALHVHVMDTTHNLISIQDSTLYFKNLEIGTTKQIVEIEGELLDVNHLGRILIVSTTARKYEFIYDWDNKEYDLFPDSIEIQLNLGTKSQTKTFDASLTGTALFSAFMEYLLESRIAGKTEGFMILRYVIELVDGTYIWPSRPIEFALPGGHPGGSTDSGPDAARRAVIVSWLTVQFPDGFGDMLNNYKNLIAGIALFGTTPQSSYVHIDAQSYSRYSYVTPEKIIEKATFNLLRRFSVEEIIAAGNTAVGVTPNYETLNTQEELTIEDEKLHSYHHATSMIYNERLLTGNITTRLYDGWTLETTNPPPPPWGEAYSLIFVFEIETSFGVKRVERVVRGDGIYATSHLLRLISYPDIRAKMVHIVYYGMVTIYVGSKKLKPHPTQNFAYCFLGEGYLGGYNHAPESKYFTDSIPYNKWGDNNNRPVIRIDNTFTDPNRVQASEIGNTLIMPYKNSYQVGNSSILGFATNGEPASEGQFGQYPIYAFTGEGIYMMDVGVDPFISSVRQINGEVCNSPKTIRNIGVGVLFATDKGLMIINGRQINSLSADFEQEVHNDYAVRHNPLYQKAIGLTELGKPDRFVSTVPFMDYLIGSNIGYDYPNREIWVSNPKYSYSYVYSIDSQMWNKRDETFITIVDDYPRYYAQQGSTCKNLSAKEGVGNINIFLLSNPVKIRLDEFKQFRRIVARGEFPVERMGMYLFGSIDGFSWAYTGGKEIVAPEPDSQLEQFEHVMEQGIFQPSFFFGGKLYFVGGAGTDNLYRLNDDGTIQLVWDVGTHLIYGNLITIGQDGMLYIPVFGLVNSGVYRIDKNGVFSGARLDINISFYGCAFGQDGRLYFLLDQKYANYGGRVWVLDDDGVIRDTNINNVFFSGTAMGQDGKLYFLGDQIYRLDDDGVIRKVSEINAKRGNARGTDGKHYFFRNDRMGLDGIYRLDDDGVIREFAAALLVVSRGTGPDGKLYITATDVYLDDDNVPRAGANNLYRIDSDGVLRLVQSDYRFIFSGVTGPDGKLYLNESGADAEKNGIYTLDNSGTIQKARTELKDFGTAKQVNGKLYFLAYNGIWYFDNSGNIVPTNVTDTEFYDIVEYGGTEYFLSDRNGIWVRKGNGEIKKTNLPNRTFRYGGVGQDGKLYFMVYGAMTSGIHSTPSGIFRITPGDPVIKAKDAIYLGAHKSAKYVAVVIEGVVTHEWNLTHISETAESVTNKKLR